MNYSHSRFENRVLIFSLSICILLYLYAIIHFSSNAPVQDDYDAILDYLNQHTHSGIFRKLQLLFSQHNEHRIVLVRTFAWLDFNCFGKINFYHLIFLGTLGWIGCIYMLWRFASNDGIDLISFIPVIILLLSFSQFDLMTWAMGSIQQYYQILFVLLAIHFSVKSKILLAICFTVLASFTGGGGLIAGLLIIMIFALNKRHDQALIALLAYCILLYIYFVLFPYTTPTAHSEWQKLTPVSFLAFTAAFLGGLGKSKTLSLIFGLMSLFIFTKQLRQFRLYSQQLMFSIIFLLLIALTVAISRGSGGLDTATNSKYSEYSLLFISSFYLAYQSKQNDAFRKRNARRIFTAFAILIYLYWLPTGFKELNSRFVQIQHGYIQYPSIERGMEILRQSGYNGVF